MNPRRILVYVLVVLVLFLAGWGAQRLALATWSAVVDYRSPFTVPLESLTGGPALSQRVILIVIDGLRTDAFDRMRFVERFRSRASMWRAWAEEPSLSFPGWTTILSGAPPEISGVTTNWYKGAVKVDHLLAAAKRSGLGTAVVGNPGWEQLFPGAIDAFVPVKDPSYTDRPAIHDTSVAVTQNGERIAREGAARLIVLHYPAPDLMGHGFGGVSEPYRDSVNLINEELTALLAGVDLATTTVILTADHGHIDPGGHGGWEQVVRQVPLMFLGAGIAPGEGFEARHADIAPTVAGLLGIPLPAHSIGRPLIEAMTVVPEGLDRRWGQQQAAIYDAYAVAVLGRHALVFTTPLGGPDPDAMLAAADELSRQMAEWRARAFKRDRQRRLPIAMVFAVLPLGFFLLHRPRRDLLPALAGTMVYFGTSLGLYFGKGYYYSLSVINREDLLKSFFETRSLDAAVAVGVAALVAGWAARRRGVGTGALAGLTTAYLVAYALVAQVLYFYVLWGFRYPWYLPDLRLGFKFYLDLLALVPVGWLAVPLVVLSLTGFGVGRLGERLCGGRERGERAPRAEKAARADATPESPASGAAPSHQGSAAPVSTADSTQSRP